MKSNTVGEQAAEVPLIIQGAEESIAIVVDDANHKITIVQGEFIVGEGLRHNVDLRSNVHRCLR